MKQKLLGYCGLDCGSCEGYLATQAKDEQAKERIAAKWREEYGSPMIRAEHVTCDGCCSDGRHGGYCPQCPVRACAVEKKVENCGKCDQFSNCKIIIEFHQRAPQAKKNLSS